ncbi:CHAT domain-containing protein [Mycena vulgaris]|nr:CHAT domain-containing protein [Mycena vulgaris]
MPPSTGTLLDDPDATASGSIETTEAQSSWDWEDPDVIAGLKLLVDRTPPGHPYLPVYQELFGQALIQRFKTSQDLNDLEVSLWNSGAALNLTPKDDPRRAKRLQHLAVCCGYRYQRLGDLQDLEDALANFQEAVELTSDQHTNKARGLRNLAVAFTLRYHKLGNLKDLEAAQKNYQAAVELTPEPPLQNLAYRDRYQRLGEVMYLQAAFQTFQEAVEKTPAGHLDRAAHLHRLAVLLGERYQRLADLNDLKAALRLDQEAVDLTPDAQSIKALYLQHLAALFKAQYQRAGDLEDLEAALQTYQAALEMTPHDHPEWAGRLQGLAMCFGDRYRRLKEPQDLESVRTHYKGSFTRMTSTPELSWKAALDWASFSEDYQLTDTLPAYLVAFQILPDILWIGNSIPVRHDAIRRLDIGQVTSTAARTCIHLSNLISAVEIIEQGLATTFQQTLQLKTDIDSLRPDYADTLRKLSYDLYSGTSSTSPRDLANERHDLLDDIRRQPGLKYFLKPKPYNVLCHASQRGPVIILNSHKNACDAIVILNPITGPVQIPLPNVSPEVLESQRALLNKLLRHYNIRIRGESESSRLFGHKEWFISKSSTESFKELLSWLWTHVVAPVYKCLSLHNINHGRIWWLPTGAFTGLPLHASPPTDQLIHSYTATLGALLDAYNKKLVHTVPKFSVIGVTHTHPSGLNSLKGVEQEVKKILSIVKVPVVCLQGEQATPEAVKVQLQDSSWVHLACHGRQNLVEPIKSHLLLYGGVLELETVLQMPVSNREFVFLAACQTAMGDSELVNESFHLGGGFIAAGFRGAIGTMWSMNDKDGPLVAEAVYSHLFRDGQQAQATDVAEALQLAVKELKVRKVPYERWIPFIHMGV